MDANTGMTKTNRGKKILIVGGVAGGASCAARARRLSEEAEIVIFERGPYVSFANCGLPYYVGNVITEEDKLLVATPELFKSRFNIDIRTESEVKSINREKREIVVEELQNNSVYREEYDALVLAPGAKPIRPNLPGIDLPGIFSLRTIPDSREMRKWIVERKAKRAVIVGGGFIGLEMAENLVKRGVKVTIVEMLPQVMPPLDPEMVTPLHDHLIEHGVVLKLGDAVAGFEQNADDTLTVSTESGKKHITDMVILAIGVRPEVDLARGEGLDIGERGGIRVDERMRTSDKHIWAVGDAVETRDVVTGDWVLIPLAGPANRQGRIAAGVILGEDFKFRGVQATAVCGVLGMTVASTGASEKALIRAAETGRRVDYGKIYVHPDNHAGYYPGASPISLKLIFTADEGKILGAQAVGKDGVEKRIDVISMAIQSDLTVFDLEEAELCYSPQFGSAKDPVNIAGMVASNVLRGYSPVADWENIDVTDALILDVRDDKEIASGHIQRALHMPVNDIRNRMTELPRDREIWVYCKIGQRAYYATRILRLNGFDARNLSGGYDTYRSMKRFTSV